MEDIDFLLREIESQRKLKNYKILQREDRASFYPSCKGLDTHHNLKHLFRDSIEVLACKQNLIWENPLDMKKARVLGVGWRFIIPPPPEVRKLLSKSLAPREVPDFLSHFIEKVPIRKRKFVSLHACIRTIKKLYRFNSFLVQAVASVYRVSTELVNNIIGRDRGLGYWMSQSIDCESVLQACTQPKMFWLRRRVTILERCRTCFDAVALAFQTIRRNNFPIPNTALRALGRLKFKLLEQPLGVAAELKELAFLCRAFYFGQQRPADALVNWLNEKQALQFSYIARCLPPPQATDSENKLLFEAFKQRLTSEPPNEDPDWRLFVRKLLRDTNPGPLKDTKVYSQPSNSSALGYKRGSQGHLAAYQDYIILGWVTDGPKVELPLEITKRASVSVYQNVAQVKMEYENVTPLPPGFVRRENALDNDLGEKFLNKVVDPIPVDDTTLRTQQVYQNYLNIYAGYRLARVRERLGMTKELSDPGSDWSSSGDEDSSSEDEQTVNLPTLGANSLANPNSLLTRPQPTYQKYEAVGLDYSNNQDAYYQRPGAAATSSNSEYTREAIVNPSVSLKATIAATPASLVMPQAGDPEPDIPENECQSYKLALMFNTINVKLSSYYNSLMSNFTRTLINTLPMMIVQPIFAEEKGLKVRVPTKTLTCFSLMLQPLRKAADAHLLKFKPASASLGGDLDVDLSEKPGPYYSLDLSVATDQHPFWLTRIFYEEVINLHPELDEYREFLPKLFGPHYVINWDQKIPDPPSLHLFGEKFDLEDFMGVWLHTDGLPMSKKLKGFDCPFWYAARAVYEWSEAYIMWAYSLYRLPGFISKQGAMMGNATSWAVLPVVTAFGCHKAKISTFKTCGDDAELAETTPERKEVFNQTISSLGALISERKSFYHKRRSLFTEIPSEDGKKQPYELLSYWVAPSGGSKGEVNWFNLPDAYQGFVQAQTGKTDRRLLRNRGLWKYSKFHNYYELARCRGLPLGALTSMGGINHPCYPKAPGLMHDRWSAYLSTRRIVDFHRYGGLSLIPKRGRALLQPPFVASEATNRYIEKHLSIHPFPKGQQGVESRKVSNFLESFENPASMLAAFHTGYQRAYHTPSVVTLSGKFYRRLKRTKPLYKGKRKLVFSAGGLERDILSKLERYVHIPNEDLTISRQRHFGLYTSENAPVLDLSTQFVR